MSVKNSLENLLADTYSIYLKTQNYHWNVTGPEFYSLHKMFEAQYLALVNDIDEIAERLRTIGELAPASFEEFINLTKIGKSNSKFTAQEMLADLSKNYEILIETASNVINAAREVDDAATEDMAIAKTEKFQETLWFIKSSMRK